MSQLSLWEVPNPTMEGLLRLDLAGESSISLSLSLLTLPFLPFLSFLLLSVLGFTFPFLHSLS